MVDGKLCIINVCKDLEFFFVLFGGGGGIYGVVMFVMYKLY